MLLAARVTHLRCPLTTPSVFPSLPRRPRFRQAPGRWPPFTMGFSGRAGEWRL